MVVTLELPEDLVSRLATPGADLSRVALEALAAAAYREGRLTMEQMRRLLGYGTRLQVDEFLKQHEIFDYTSSDLERDRQTLARLRSTSQSAGANDGYR